MPRTMAVLPEGARITDYISLGVISKTFPVARINTILEETGKAGKRERDLPARVMMYYVIALALYMQSSYREVLRCLLEGVRWLMGPEAELKVAGRAGISRARKRLGLEPVRRLHDEVVGPIAQEETKGAWYRPWRLVSLDGSTMAVADTVANDEAFGRPGASRGKTAHPQFRFVSLVENGTHILFGTQLGSYSDSETTLAKASIASLEPGMLCLADRSFYGYALWKQAQNTGAELMWRIKVNLNLPCSKRLSDGSYLSNIYPSQRDRRHDSNGIVVRVIEYRLAGAADAEPIYRLLTTILDPEKAPAEELAALYQERWEIETAFDELKTHLRGSQIVLRSKSPDLVQQEFYGLLMAHFAIRGLMHEAAMEATEDPDNLSFVHAVRVVRRKLPLLVAISPSGDGSLP